MSKVYFFGLAEINIFEAQLKTHTPLSLLELGPRHSRPRTGPLALEKGLGLLNLRLSIKPRCLIGLPIVILDSISRPLLGNNLCNI